MEVGQARNNLKLFAELLENREALWWRTWPLPVPTAVESHRSSSAKVLCCSMRFAAYLKCCSAPRGHRSILSWTFFSQVKGQRQKWNHERNRKDLFEDTCNAHILIYRHLVLQGFEIWVDREFGIL